MTTSRLAALVSFRVHQAPEVARLAPPFRIHCLYTDVEPEKRLRETVNGDLSGVLETLFHEQQDGIHITFSWYVRVTNPALNLLGYVAERMYRHSHDSVMKSGEKGLSEYCKRLAASGSARQYRGGNRAIEEVDDRRGIPGVSEITGGKVVLVAARPDR